MITAKPASVRKDAAANRSRILDAAREEFAERGLAAEMKDVAARAGVGIGTLYRHFDSREGLIAAIVQDTADELVQCLGEAFAEQSPEDALRSMLRAGVEVHARIGMFEVVKEKQLEGTQEKGIDLLRRLFERGMREGVFRPDLDIEVMIAALHAVFESGKIFEVAAERGNVLAADIFADLFIRAARPTAG